jgi:hypothetical protein
MIGYLSLHELGQSSEKSAKRVSRFFFCDCPPPDPEVVVKNMLPAFQAPAHSLPLDGPKFKFLWAL